MRIVYLCVNCSMSKIILLDTGLLGMITHPRPNSEIMQWMDRLQYQDVELMGTRNF